MILFRIAIILERTRSRSYRRRDWEEQVAQYQLTSRLIYYTTHRQSVMETFRTLFAKPDPNAQVWDGLRFSLPDTHVLL